MSKFGRPLDLATELDKYGHWDITWTWRTRVQNPNEQSGEAQIRLRFNNPLNWRDSVDMFYLMCERLSSVKWYVTSPTMLLQGDSTEANFEVRCYLNVSQEHLIQPPVDGW